MMYCGGGWVSDLVESIKQSRANRAAMEKKFGTMPLSILRLNRGALSKRMFSYQTEQRGRSVTAKSGIAIAELEEGATKQRALERVALGITGGGSVLDRKENGSRVGASIMPAELVEFFIKYYARPGDVYLDPFMGQGVQMQVAKLMGLHYYGYDLSTEFFGYIEAVRAKIDDGKTTIQATHGDSRHPDAIPDGIGDFSFHSPPYWDIEFYGTESEQLGYNHTYPEFLDGMQQVAAAWLPKFKASAWHVVNVNDFRKDGRFYPYHADTIALFQRAGWQLADTWIIDGLVGGLPKAFAVDFNMKRIAPKVHEYALVFRKP